MNLKLIHLEQRIKELDSLAKEVLDLAERLSKQEDVQPDLSDKGQRWYRGCRELLVQQNFSGLKEFDNCYQHTGLDYHRVHTNIERYINYDYTYNNVAHIYLITEKKHEYFQKEYFPLFCSDFQKARSLLHSVVDEINSRELPITTELSFHVSANEFETAKDIFDKYGSNDVFIRVSGIVARVALERHIRTVADTRNIVIIRNPPSKPHDDFADVTTTLMKSGVITSHQKSELDLLYRTGNDCAHQKGEVVASNVKQLIERGRELASMIL